MKHIKNRAGRRFWIGWLIVFTTLFLAIGWLLRPVIADLVPRTRLFVTNDRTSEQAYLLDLTRDYLVQPLLTVGEEIPLLSGSFDALTPSNQTFAFSGIPDGLGFYQTAGAKYLYVNHELSSNQTTPLTSATPGHINGARVSLIAFDKDWQVIGGKNLIQKVEADGRTYTLDTTSGDYLDPQGAVLEGGNGPNFSRFCSGYLAAAGFRDLVGAPGPIWFAPEEVGPNGRGWAVYPNGTAVALDGLGRYSKEQVYPASQYRADNESRTVLISTEDSIDGEIYLFIGQQTAQDPNGFANGTLYVLRVEDNQGQVYDYETMPQNQPLTAKWTAVPDSIALGNGSVLSDWVNANDRSTNFRRLEDMHEDPNNPGTFYVATTGHFAPPPGSISLENPYGKLYSFTLNPQDPAGDMEIELLLVGGETTGLSYDNMTVNSAGSVLLQEDRAGASPLIFANQRRYARVLAFDPVSSSSTFLFEANQAGIDPGSANDYGNWETSGIIEVAFDPENGQSWYALTIQAHSLSDPDYIQGGQLVLIYPVVSNGFLPSTFSP